MVDEKNAAWRRRDMALRLSHPIAAVVHLASATFILLYGLNAADNCIRTYDVSVLPGFEITKWYFRCYDRDTEKYTASTSCAVKDRAFYAKGWRTQFDSDDKCPDVRPEGPSINILVFAALFAYWSGLWHVVASVSAFGVAGGSKHVLEWLSRPALRCGEAGLATAFAWVKLAGGVATPTGARKEK